MRGIPRIAETFKIEIVEARFRDCHPRALDGRSMAVVARLEGPAVAAMRQAHEAKWSHNVASACSGGLDILLGIPVPE